jgi:peptidoglycan/xylan/chitin deacetylase (PgdA/CDA1 family)
MSASKQTPKVLISLDFEMRWGVHDVYGSDIDAYRDNLMRVRDAVPALLKLFDSHDIRATWAPVGALGCASWNEYFERAPEPPNYEHAHLRIKPEYADLDPDGELHFAPELLHAIISAPGQELGTHTFSHLYLREKGITAADVSADLTAVSNLYAARFGSEPLSLVFPRNQPAFIDVIRACGIRIWRGNPGPWYYETEDSEHNGPVPRALKLIDGINPLRRLAAPQTDDMTRASLFLRLNLPRYLWAAHVARIRSELIALKSGEIFHIWFHPDNLGRDMAHRLSRVEEVLELIAKQQASGRLQSRSMGDLVQ